MDVEVTPDEYDAVLRDYFETRGEEALYRASRLSQACIESGLGPEDIVALHFEALDRIQSGRSHLERARAVGDAQQFLLEVMIAYGVRYREYLEIRLQESLRDAEALAALEHQRALDAERLEHERAEILAVVAHELRTPLTAAMGQLDMASRSVHRGQAEHAERYLGSAREALVRLSRLSADLVEASRGETPSLRPVHQDLGVLVGQVLAWAQPAADEKSIQLQIEAEEVAASLYADPDALISVLGNLLSNAIRYTPEGGQVVIRYGTDARTAWIEVEDNGIGMSPEEQARIFEKFYRAPGARTVEAKGLGLGLTLVRQLVGAHDGRVEVYSAPGDGTRIRVTLPLQGLAREDVQRDSVQ